MQRSTHKRFFSVRPLKGQLPGWSLRKTEKSNVFLPDHSKFFPDHRRHSSQPLQMLPLPNGFAMMMSLSNSFEAPSCAFPWFPTLDLSDRGKSQPTVNMVVVERRDDTPEPVRRKVQKPNRGEKLRRRRTPWIEVETRTRTKATTNSVRS